MQDQQINDILQRLSTLESSKDLSRDNETALRERLGIKEAFPVGSIFIAAVATNPNTLLGYGTWTQYAQGQVLVGYSAGDSNFGTLEGTGGEATHTLTINEMPAHTHTAIVSVNSIGGSVTNTVTPSMQSGTTSSAGSGLAHNNLQPYITVYMWKRTI